MTQAPTSHSDTPVARHRARSDARSVPRLRVVPRSALAYQPDPPERGYAHIGWPSYPAGAPGHLDFGPLMLFAVGELYPGEGSRMHRHAQVESLIVVRRGRLRHRATVGEPCVAQAGDVCLLSAGSGAAHQETAEGDETLEALVLWVRPDHPDRPPCYRRQSIPVRAEQGWITLASGREVDAPAAIRIDSDTALHGARLRTGERLEYNVGPDRGVYLATLDGAISVADRALDVGDRALVDSQGTLTIRARTDAEVYLVDVPLHRRP